MKRGTTGALRIDPDPDGERRRAARARLGLDPATGRPRRRLRRAFVRLLLACVVLSAGPVALLRFVDPPFTAFMLGERWAAWRVGDSRYTLEQRWRPLTAMAPALARAAIAAEDQRFMTHHGFDFASIRGALAAREAGGPLRGASTISQQVAKNLFLWRGRDWLRKGLEAWFTLWLEALLPKSRILEIYLNVAQFGAGVYGVEAASVRYFGRAANAVDEAQAALLAAVLPNPLRYRVDTPSARVLRRQQWIRRQMPTVSSVEAAR